MQIGFSFIQIFKRKFIP